MQNKFLSKINYEERNALIGTHIKLLDYAKKNKIPVFTLEYDGSGNTTKELSQELATLDNTYLNKYNNNAFLKIPPEYHNLHFEENPKWDLENRNNRRDYPENSNLITKIDNKKITDIIITGVFKSACVLATTKGAYNRYINTHTSEELMEDPISEKKSSEQRWFYENSNHYKTLDELIENINPLLPNQNL